MTIAGLCGLIIFVLLAVMLIAGVPIAVALAVSSICAILPVLNMGASVLTGAQRIFSGISVFSLLAIPFFILAGNLMNKGGIAIRLINFAKLFTGNIPGALAHTNAVANMLFGAISGSGTAAASAMGSIIGPIEEEEGYDRDFSAAAKAVLKAGDAESTTAITEKALTVFLKKLFISEPPILFCKNLQFYTYSYTDYNNIQLNVNKIQYL